MSVIGIVINLVLAALLAAALGMGWRLNRRLAVLRDSHDGFARAVAELDLAAQRAEQGLSDLRAATDEAADVLADRIEKAHALAARLERLSDRAPAPQPDELVLHEARPLSRPLEGRLGSLLSAARAARTRPEPPRPARREPLSLRPRPFSEDDLFEDPAPLGAMTGAAR